MREWGFSLGRWLARGVGTGFLGLVAAAGCAERPVSSDSPSTISVSVQDAKQSSLDQIDLLFMIDNSISMADKQEILAQAVPALLSQFTSPQPDPVTGKLPFEPIDDIHIGIITSSLGGHGGDQCSKSGPSSNPTQYDNAHLVGSGIRPQANLSSYQGLGFLWWDPHGTASPPGEANAASLIASFTEHVKAVGESGCGYEASLESWYRFLIDPAPPADVVVTNGVATVTGVDSVILQQRKDFLRPSSLVAIIMLSDENDCSIVDGSSAWLAAQITAPNNQAFHLPRGTAACSVDPNDPCCRSCFGDELAPPAGCATLAADPECKKGAWDDVGDHPNLRCWEQKRRFGASFLYPTRRYVEGLTQPTICPKWDENGPVDCSTRVRNPLLDTGSQYPIRRDANLIHLAAIVGVPWQDISTDASLAGDGLEYLTSYELSEKGRWDWLTPKCLEKVQDPLPRPMPNLCQRWDLTDQPDDALMVESSLPRSGTALALEEPIADPSAGFMANSINGHEWHTADADLQYACIFERRTPLNCAAPAPTGCDCDDVTTTYTANNPLCQGGSGYSTSQGYAKAFPGIRQLQVARDFATNSIVASICPKVTTGSTADPSYGYNPAVQRILDRLKGVLAGQCLNIEIELPKNLNGDPDPALGEQVCTIVEVIQSSGSGCGLCNPDRNRRSVRPELVQPILNRLKDTAQCGQGLPPCDTESWCMCELGLATDLGACLNELEPNEKEIFGWCYIDAEADPPIGNPAVVEGCEPKRQIRFLGVNTPANGSTMHIACMVPPAGSQP